MTPYIISIVILLVLSGVFSATETAFTSVSKIKMKNLASDDNESAKLVLERQQYCQYRDDFNSHCYVHQAIWSLRGDYFYRCCDGFGLGVRGDIT